MVEGKDDGFSGFCFLQQSLFRVGVAFSSDGLDIEQRFVFGEQLFGDLLGGQRSRSSIRKCSTISLSVKLFVFQT